MYPRLALLSLQTIGIRGVYWYAWLLPSFISCTQFVSWQMLVDSAACDWEAEVSDSIALMCVLLP